MIKISRVKLKDLNIKWVNWLNDSEITKYSIQRKKKHTLNTQKKFIEKKLKDNSSILFKILDKNNFVGVIEIKNIDKINFTCEISYLVGEKNFWGKGIGTKAVSLASDYCFKILKIKNILSATMSNNIASKKVLKNNNFRIFGKIKNYFSYKKNMRIDKIFFIKTNL